jgi:hypothetical protein
MSIGWKDAAELVGITAIVSSLIFVGFQIRQDQEIAAAQSYMDATAVLTEENQYIDGNKEIWLRGLDGAELSQEDEYTFQAICRSIYLRKIAQWQRIRRLQTGRPASVIQGYAYNIHTYPGLRRFFDELVVSLEESRSAFGRTRGDGSFTSAVEVALGDLDRNPPPPQSKKSYYIY